MHIEIKMKPEKQYRDSESVAIMWTFDRSNTLAHSRTNLRGITVLLKNVIMCPHANAEWSGKHQISFSPL